MVPSGQIHFDKVTKGSPYLRGGKAQRFCILMIWPPSVCSQPPPSKKKTRLALSKMRFCILTRCNQSTHLADTQKSTHRAYTSRCSHRLSLLVSARPGCEKAPWPGWRWGNSRYFACSSQEPECRVTWVWGPWWFDSGICGTDIQRHGHWLPVSEVVETSAAL